MLNPYYTSILVKEWTEDFGGNVIAIHYVTNIFPHCIVAPCLISFIQAIYILCELNQVKFSHLLPQLSSCLRQLPTHQRSPVVKCCYHYNSSTDSGQPVDRSDALRHSILSFQGSKHKFFPTHRLYMYQTASHHKAQEL